MATRRMTFGKMVIAVAVLGLMLGTAAALARGARADEQPAATPAPVAQAETPLWQRLADYNEALFTEEVKNGPFISWPLEKKHEWQQRELETGYTPTGILHGLPREGDITREEALDAVLASKKVMIEGVSGKALATEYTVLYSYNVIDPDHPLWEVHFQQKNNEPYNVLHTVSVDPVSGQVAATPGVGGEMPQED